MRRKILITAGGTGGHVFPALAVAKKLEIQYDVLWVGAKIGIENEVVPKNNIPLITISISGLRKKGFIKALFMPFLLIYSCSQCFKVIISQRPDVVVGFGGYATFPICVMAWIFRIPVVIHEQNSVAGLSNKILSKIAKYILIAFKGVLDTPKTCLVGNPVREDIAKLDTPKHRALLRGEGLNILIMGGSMGAQVLNETMPEVFSKLSNVKKIIHQVGRGDVVSVNNNYLRFGIKADVVKFIYNMGETFAMMDLVICRAGASTVSEICTLGIAAIFIPYPYAVDNHQFYNAKLLVESGGAFMILQSDLTAKLLVSIINKLDKSKCLIMANKSRKLALENSTDKIVTIIEKCIV